MRHFIQKFDLKKRISVMKNLIGVFLAISVLVSGCMKEDETLGLNLLPGIKAVETRNFQYSRNISAYTFLDDNYFLVDTNTVSSPRFSLLGSFNDPVFGYTNASFGAQFRMPYNPRYEKNAADGPAVLDSLVLQMSYKYVYGDTISPQTIMIRELTDDLRFGYGYLSSYKIRDHVSPVLLGSKNIIPKFRTDSTKRDTSSQILRIRMNPDLGNRLLKMDTLNYVSNDKFLSVFKGLFIETAPLSRKGSLMRIDSPSGFLVVYYHNSKNDSLAYAYNISANSAGVPGYTHDYSTTPFYANLNKETGNDTLVFLQPTGGTKVKINIPGISTWKDSTNFIINKATLTFHIDTLMTDMRRYEIPFQLFLKIVDSDGKEKFPFDAQLSLSYYGGFYDSRNQTYSFNVTQHLQQVIKGEKPNNGFYLVPSERNTSPKRVVLKSHNSSRPVELNMVYTRYKQ